MFVSTNIIFTLDVEQYQGCVPPSYFDIKYLFRVMDI